MKYLALLLLPATAFAETPQNVGKKSPLPPPNGSITGTVLLEGTYVPERKQLVRDSDPYCAKTPKLAEDLIVTKGHVKDVVVRVKNPPILKSKLDTSKPVMLDQKECTYTPHVVTVAPGQKLAVRNSDGTFHNVNGSISGKLLWNKPQAAKDPDLSLDATAKAGDVIDIVCNVHPWMHAYAVVVEHPYAAVTAEDGSFTIPDLPAGSYTLEAWHPKLGTRTLDVKVGTGAKASAVARISYKNQ